MIAAVIHTNMNIEIYEHSTDLYWLQERVDGPIEAIGLDFDGNTMYMNEEGKIRGMPVNVIATALYRLAQGPYDIIVGDVVVVGSTAEGENADLTPHGFDMIGQAVEDAKRAWS